jgi:hypothetical protein
LPYNLIDLIGILLGLIIDKFLAALKVVFGDNLVFLLLFELLDSIPPDIPDANLSLFARLLALRNELITTISN